MNWYPNAMPNLRPSNLWQDKNGVAAICKSKQVLKRQSKVTTAAQDVHVSGPLFSELEREASN